ncbi:hypothetical protein ACGFNP_42990 [Nonomuraea sp. NPDC049269]|uniref:hypothetical protein n=1 Tax=Nonomuraea sp. NPDC049269 TaxID=3364349 RepID=UPI00371F83DB
MTEWTKLIEAIASLAGALAWPIAVVVAVRLIMKHHRMAFGRLIDRVKSFSFPGGQVDLGEIEAAQEEQVEKLVEHAADPNVSEEARRDIISTLTKEAEQLGRIRTASGYVRIICSNCGLIFATRIRSKVKCPSCLCVISGDYLSQQAHTGE